MANATAGRSAALPAQEGGRYAAPRRDLLIRVAKLYFNEGLSQVQIAAKIGVSRSNVSKLLQACKERRIVEIRIDETSSSGVYLEGELRRLLALSPLVIVPASADPEQAKRHLGTAAARLLEASLKDGLRLGISWGSSLYHLVEAFRPARLYRVDVVQLMGGLGARDLSMDGTNLAYKLCGKLNGECHVIQAPLVVRRRSVRDSLLAEPDIRHTLQLAASLDIALVGIGSSHPAASALVRSGHLTKEQSAALLRRGAVGNVLGWQLDVNGRLCAAALNERIVGLHPDKLKRTPLVVGVAGGGLKAEAILGAVRGGYINALVTDEAAALGMLQRLREPSGLRPSAP